MEKNPEQQAARHHLIILEKHLLTNGELFVYSNGIFHFRLSDHANTSTLSDLQEQYKLCMQLRNGTTGPFLADDQRMTRVGPEEKTFIKNTFHHFTSSAAILVSSSISKFIYNTYMHIHSTPIPMKAFQDYDSAIVWLIEVEKK